MWFTYLLITFSNNDDMVTRYISEHQQYTYLCVVWVTHMVWLYVFYSLTYLFCDDDKVVKHISEHILSKHICDSYGFIMFLLT